MPGFLEFFSQQRRLLSQQRELKRLREEVAMLQDQNESMRDGMRRCLSCDYRIEFKQRQGDPEFIHKEE
jgi:cell division protein FtsB